MNVKWWILWSMLTVLAACSGTKELSNQPNGAFPIGMDTLTISASEDYTVETPQPQYRAAATRAIDLLHTKLDVRFDLQNQWLMGVAELQLKPYFYPIDRVTLDAKGFDIKSIVLLANGREDTLQYDYDQLQLTINLAKNYTREDTVNIQIDYTAKPNELEKGGSAAITSDIGLYFIDPLDEDPEKPTQIWTQGETEASSCWFPTVDKPNERMTQEMYITVAKNFQTLSNGKLEFSLENKDGTRTDYWVQKKPHAPYLTMMAIGEFAVAKDTWRDSVEVHYYVEPKYASVAKRIYPNTVEMLEFYSQLMGVDYPWDKYHQVAVRDYVSGAMENTSAVIFGDFVQRTERELIDGDSEDIVAHELFHHWFGDLVTCESWSNLPLNESFATYGEYLWLEHKYGREKADAHLFENLGNYLSEAEYKQEDLIRFSYKHRDDMFDSHSYAKGGHILHLLREHTGDEAFFTGLKKYLEDNAYQAVEMHHLRLAMEEVSGEDLNWFFNQWFFSSGHPILQVTTEYDDASHDLSVSIAQSRVRTATPVYQLPLAIDVYFNGKKERHQVMVDNINNTFNFHCPSEPELVNVDANKTLLGVIRHKKSAATWSFQYRNAPLFRDRYDALDACGEMAKSDSLALKTVKRALSDKNETIRILALNWLGKLPKSLITDAKIKVKDLAQNDPKTSVKAMAINLLANGYTDDKSLKNLYLKELSNPSYRVMGEALNALAVVDAPLALQEAKKLEKENNRSVLLAIAEVYGKAGTDSEAEFFIKNGEQFSGYSQIGFLINYGKFLEKDLALETIDDAVGYFERNADGHAKSYVRLISRQVMNNLKAKLSRQKTELESKTDQLEQTNPQAMEVMEWKNEAEKMRRLLYRIDAILEKLDVR